MSLSAFEVYGHTLYDFLQIVKSEKEQVSIRDFGKAIPENMDFEPDPDSKKDRAFAERITDYKRHHPERLRKPNP